MDITRPLRQILYGLLFSYSDLIYRNHRKKQSQEPILIREWHPCRLKPDRVQAELEKTLAFNSFLENFNFFENILKFFWKLFENFWKILWKFREI